MTATPFSEASQFPGNLLRRCHQISVAIFLRKCEAYNLTQLQYILLCALEEKGAIDQITLGGHTALDRNTVAVVVRKLEERGLVTRHRNPEDRRSMLVTLTAEGERLRTPPSPPWMRCRRPSWPHWKMTSARSCANCCVASPTRTTT